MMEILTYNYPPSSPNKTRHVLWAFPNVREARAFRKEYAAEHCESAAHFAIWRHEDGRAAVGSETAAMHFDFA